MRRYPVVLALLLFLAACVSVSKSVLSRAHIGQPVPRDEVQVFFADDSVPPHERVAILSAQGDDSLTDPADMIDKLRQEAGKLGANAIILSEVKDASTGAKIAAAVFGTTALRKGQAIAIFVPAMARKTQ
jgi:hypothetical protein